MPVVGELNVSVQYSEQIKNLDLIVVAGDGPTLLGRSWLEQLHLDLARFLREKPHSTYSHP